MDYATADVIRILLGQHANERARNRDRFTADEPPVLAGGIHRDRGSKLLAVLSPGVHDRHGLPCLWGIDIA